MLRYIIFSIFCIIILGCTTPTNTKIQASTNDRRYQSRQLPRISYKLIKKLDAISSLVIPPANQQGIIKPDFPSALALLNEIEDDCKLGCNNYEKSQIHRYYGYIYHRLNTLEKAKNAYDQVLAYSPDIPVAVELDTLRAALNTAVKLQKLEEIRSYLTKIEALAPQQFGTIAYVEAVELYDEGFKQGALDVIDVLIDKYKNQEASATYYSLKISILNSQGKTDEIPVLEKEIEKFEAYNETLVYSVTPTFPKKAIQSKINGYCTVEFSIRHTGKTYEHKIVDCPNPIFIPSSIEAAKMFIYRPKIVNGKAINIKGVRNRFTFNYGN